MNPFERHLNNYVPLFNPETERIEFAKLTAILDYADEGALVQAHFGGAEYDVPLARDIDYRIDTEGRLELEAPDGCWITPIRKRTTRRTTVRGTQIEVWQDYDKPSGIGTLKGWGPMILQLAGELGYREFAHPLFVFDIEEQ